MPDRHSVYYGDEEPDQELKEWIEEVEDLFGNRANFYKKAAQHFRDEKGDLIDELRNEDNEMIT